MQINCVSLPFNINLTKFRRAISKVENILRHTIHEIMSLNGFLPQISPGKIPIILQEIRVHIAQVFIA